MSKQINMIRQILMNELGLTRKLIREETERIVIETVDKHINRLLSEGFFDKLVIETTLKYLRKNWWEKDLIRQQIEKLAQEKAKEIFDQIWGTMINEKSDE